MDLGSAPLRVVVACIAVCLGLAASACHEPYQPKFPADMALPLPQMMWSRNPGMPQAQPRSGMPLVLAPTERRFLGFGGSPTTQLDTWAFSLRDDAWSTLILGSLPPAGRTGHCAAYLPAENQILFVGGHDDTGQPVNTPLVLAVGTPSFVAVSSAAPMPTDGCTAAYHLRAQRAVIFGGQTGATPNADTWLFEPASQTFAQAAPAHPPSARSGGRLVADPGNVDEVSSGRLVLFGGASDAGELADIWIWDGSDWGELGTIEDPDAGLTSDPRPLGRSGAAVAIDPTRRVLYVFGGQREGGWLADLWRLDLVTRVWSRLQLDGGPTGRADASVAYDPVLDRMLLFGGRSDAGPLADGWTLSPVL